MSTAQTLFSTLQPRACVITATQRLARELGRAFDQWQQQQHKIAWPSADILPYTAWLQRSWQQLCFRSPARPGLLTDLQTLSCWRQLIDADIAHQSTDTAPLWNTHATAKTALNAWQLLHIWRINPNDLRQSTHADHQQFVRWAERFKQLCQTNNWIDSHSLGEALCVALGTAPELLREVFGRGLGATPQLIFCGFDRITPQHQALIAALRAAAFEVEVQPQPAATPTPPRVLSYPDAPTQWLAAAHWARDKLQHAPHSRLAIVCTDMHSERAAIGYALKQVLTPSELLQPSAAEKPYHFSLGDQLADIPVVAAALASLLSLVQRAPLDAAQVRELILSPFIRGGSTERTARGQLAKRCEEYLPYQVTLTKLHQFITRPGPLPAARPPPLLAALLKQSLATVARRAKQQRFFEWSKDFKHWLDQLGWPGDASMDSHTFQVVEAFDKLLRSLAQLDLTQPPPSATQALSWLKRIALEQPFQSEAPPAPLQVLGVLEAAGMRFDALWFGNLTQQNWPPAAAPNPFIDIALQRKAGIDAADASGCTRQAEQWQQRLAGSCAAMVLSYPRFDRELICQPSPLLPPAVPVEPQSDATDGSAGLHAHYLAQATELEWLADEHGLPVGADEQIRGGAGLLESQAICPSCAYARYRLAADSARPRQAGLDAAERGSLVHKVLQLVWEEIGSAAAARALSREQRHEILNRNIQLATQRYRVSSGCGEAFFQVQSAWLLQTLEEWFEVEAERLAPYEVIGREQLHELALRGLTLRLKIDRIDRFADGSVGLIDYKTGNIASLSDWLKPRPVSPQLPLYALSVSTTQDKPIGFIGYAKVKRGECEFIGIANDSVADSVADGAAPRPFSDGRDRVRAFAKSTVAKQVDDWPALLQHWQTQLQQMADEFMAGDARRDPLGEGVCAECPLAIFCRGELRYA